ncbi:MAG: hypothetical protein K9J37_20915 [Saprospiraceae bacterium]|nr:hypothetical protein [Saprospiraceae bacterium]MCF8252382.1 hypothetical protein [Saprospiraceae bacterium]MCF8282252.1 hypothetical protein [Bacteroidales bacterium]MCF8313994.1 hypothetical protein [Saprospiraceae bacterium]MCF8442712.1 hypothetical protein [Saprospiraceae bacterium]
MKKLSFAILFMLAFVAVSMAQPGQRGEKAQEKMEAFKIAFFTEKLQLTPDESKAFWPLYNQFENERDAMKDKFDLDGQRFELLADKEVEAAIMQHFDMEEQMVKLRRDYVRRFMEVLPIRKVAMLQRIDNDFKRALLEEIKKRRDARQGGAPNPRRG